MKDDFHKYLTCVGVKMEGVTYVPKHRTTDGCLHYSAGICNSCVELSRKLKTCQKLSFNGLEKELEKVWEYKGTPLIETPLKENYE